MGFLGFGKSSERVKKEGILKLMQGNLISVVVLIVITLILFQGIGLLLEGPLGIDVNLGPIFILLPLAIASTMGIAIVKKMLGDLSPNRSDMLAVIIVAGLALLVLFFLRDLVPEVFSESMLQLQSMIGFK